jgi:hypothetical protein
VSVYSFIITTLFSIQEVFYKGFRLLRPTYLLTYLLAYLLTCLLTYLLAYLLIYLLTCLLTYLLTYLLTHLLARWFYSPCMALASHTIFIQTSLLVVLFLQLFTFINLRSSSISSSHRFLGLPLFLLPPGVVQILFNHYIFFHSCHMSQPSKCFNFRSYIRLSTHIPQFLIIPNFSFISFLLCSTQKRR